MSLPDAELVALTALRAEFPAVTFGTQIPATMPLPFVQVRRSSGPRLHPTLATRAPVDVSVWDDDRQDASDLARNIQAFIETESTAWTHARCTTEPFEVPPPPDAAVPQGVYRFQASYRLVVRAS